MSTWLAGLPSAESLAYGGAAAALVALGIALAARGARGAAFGLLWWLGALVPLAAIAILDYPWPGLARWLYVGLPGLLLLLWQVTRPLGRRAQLAAFVVVGGAWLALLERDIPVWHDDVALYAAMIEESPEDAWAWRALGMTQLEIHNYEEAARLFHGAVERDRSDEVHAAAGLEALAWTHLGRCDEAVAQYRDHPPTPAVLPDLFIENAAACFGNAGRLERARQLWSLCAASRPGCQAALRATEGRP